MKYRHFFVMMASALIFLFSSCDKDILPSMTATVDGKEWSASVGTVVGTSYNNYTTIVGVNLQGQKILLAFKGTEPGTYTLNPLEAGIDQVSVFITDTDAEDDDTMRYVSSNGQVVISSVEDKRISGTFRFTGVNSKENVIEISNGVFTNVLYL